MGKLFDIPDDLEVFDHDAPDVAKDLAEKYPPNILYRMKSTGQEGSPVAYAEDGTIRLYMSAKFNDMMIFDQEVFGVDPDDPEECDVPDEPAMGSDAKMIY